MTLPSSAQTITKVRQGVTWKLKSNAFTIGYPYNKPTDVSVWMGDQLLHEGQHYHLEMGVVTLHDDQLGLSQDSPLKITFYTRRLTELQDIQFKPGHPIRAEDLNDWMQQLTMRTEELDGLVKSNAWVADTPPPEPWTGMLWVSNVDYRIYSWTGTEWVDVR